MNKFKLGIAETKFANIIWENEPISSSELWKKSEKELQWKKTTSFTVLKRLCNKGIFINNNGLVTSVISKDEFYSMQSEEFVNETFGGSLPAFFAAFTARKKITVEEINELRRMIKEYEEEQ